MIIILKEHADTHKVQSLVHTLQASGLRIHESEGAETTILGLIGDTSTVDMEALQALDFVQDVKRVTEPYKAANRKFHAEDTIVRAGNSAIGGGFFSVIAGPCSVESAAQIESVAKSVKSSGAAFLRGGAFKPRTSP